MSKKYEYKGKIIENIPYGSEARWFITNEDGSKDAKFKYPERTLKEAKKAIDIDIRHGYINKTTIEVIKNNSYTKCESCGSNENVKAINFGGKIKPVALCQKCREKTMLVLSDEQHEEFQNSDLAYELELMGE